MAAKRKTKGPSWSEVKAALVTLDQKQLLNLVADLYRLSNENKTFFHTRFGIGDDQLGPYRKIIEECMFPDIYSNKPIQVSKAKKAISDYSKAVGDPAGIAELMTFFVECGNSFTVNYGDIDEAFYDALNRMYRRTIDKVLTLPKERQDEFRARLEVIMTSSSNIGWGYHDTLCDDYYDAFPEDE
ncbi:conserved hypothetical protein [uncultured Desulfobacterium sp.]|uniref:Uncharacterized protein n=1 Tax=uncultured Desulfobacterium sp. TaxID=201089 RepID=A0A445MWS0_9BACT|nr:conserved hypothetical protein [uncultured Desulfobacterium sp.]